MLLCLYCLFLNCLLFSYPLFLNLSQPLLFLLLCNSLPLYLGCLLLFPHNFLMLLVSLSHPSLMSLFLLLLRDPLFPLLFHCLLLPPHYLFMHSMRFLHSSSMMSSLLFCSSNSLLFGFLLDSNTLCFLCFSLESLSL